MVSVSRRADPILTGRADGAGRRTRGAAQCAGLPAILTVQNVEKSFGTRRVLTGASFAVHDRDRIALVGLNGSGKSTLLRMMVSSGAGDPAAWPDAGQITMQRDLRVEYVPQ